MKQVPCEDDGFGCSAGGLPASVSAKSPGSDRSSPGGARPNRRRNGSASSPSSGGPSDVDGLAVSAEILRRSLNNWDCPLRASSLLSRSWTTQQGVQYRPFPLPPLRSPATTLHLAQRVCTDQHWSQYRSPFSSRLVPTAVWQSAHAMYRSQHCWQYLLPCSSSCSASVFSHLLQSLAFQHFAQYWSPLLSLVSPNALLQTQHAQPAQHFVQYLWLFSSRWSPTATLHRTHIKALQHLVQYLRSVSSTTSPAAFLHLLHRTLAQQLLQ
mmetsp:Transcript_45255/g.127998  ORF Transcript_45255/g.127998 Transcript_45255/m.127998 type:complete len:268 (-) Transcript_45255:872-1675(-)